jgi:hypothetical protein
LSTLDFVAFIFTIWKAVSLMQQTLDETSIFCNSVMAPLLNSMHQENNVPSIYNSRFKESKNAAKTLIYLTSVNKSKH